VIKVRENQRVRNYALYVALGIDLEGQKEWLGMWMAQNEGAKFWLAVFTELQNRGVKDIFIACMDGLDFPSRSRGDALPADPRATLYGAHGAQLAHICLFHTSQGGGCRLETRLRGGDRSGSAGLSRAGSFEVGATLPQHQQAVAHGSHVIPLFAFPEDIGKVIYTTNATRSLNRSLRKVTRNQRIFPSDEAAFKVVYLALQNIAKQWTMPIHDWKPALNCFAIEFAGRFPQ